MFKSPREYLQKKALDLNIDRKEDIKLIQHHLDGLYGSYVKVGSLNRGVLRLTTSSASVATELRFRKKDTIADVNNIVRHKVLSVIIKIGSD